MPYVTRDTMSAYTVCPLPEVTKKTKTYPESVVIDIRGMDIVLCSVFNRNDNNNSGERYPVGP